MVTEIKGVVIIAAKRTPVRTFGGDFAGIRAVDLALPAVNAAIQHAPILPDHIDGLIFGMSATTGSGPNVARQIALAAQLPQAYATTFAMQEAADLQSILYAAQTISDGHADMMIAGGVAALSQMPYLLRQPRFGILAGNQVIEDSTLTDMIGEGLLSEKMTEIFSGSFSEDELKDYMQVSRQRAQSWRENAAYNTLTPVMIQRKREKISIYEDDYAASGNDYALADGASCLMLCGKNKAKKLGLKPLAEIKGFARVAVSPKDPHLPSVSAVKLILARQKLLLSAIQHLEYIDISPLHALIFARLLALKANSLNPRGSTFVYGNLIGANCVRALVDMLTVPKPGMQLLASCGGGGQGISLLLEVYS